VLRWAVMIRFICKWKKRSFDSCKMWTDGIHYHSVLITPTSLTSKSLTVPSLFGFYVKCGVRLSLSCLVTLLRSRLGDPFMSETRCINLFFHWIDSTTEFVPSPSHSAHWYLRLGRTTNITRITVIMLVVLTSHL